MTSYQILTILYFCIGIGVSLGFIVRCKHLTNEILPHLTLGSLLGLFWPIGITIRLTYKLYS